MTIGMTTKARFRFLVPPRFRAFPPFPGALTAISDLPSKPVVYSTAGLFSEAAALGIVVLAVSGINGSLAGTTPGLLESEESGFGLNLFSLTVIPPVHCWLPDIILAGKP